MERSKIIAAINKWEALVSSQDYKAINKLFEQGNSFNYKYPSYADTAITLHTYPGVVTDEKNNDLLYFFVIPDQYDKVNYKDIFADYTEACPVFANLSSNRIPNIQARNRMKYWNDYHEAWIPVQCACADGLFLAFSVESIDFEIKAEGGDVTMALKPADTEIGFIAELIVTNKQNTRVYYDDFTTPVPPYGASALSQDSFYLLTL